MHNGIDLAAKAGTKIQSVMGGVVLDVKFDKGGGNMIKVLQDDGTTAVYMHMLRPSTYKKGQRVNTGDVVGLVGSTGRSTGNHLHLEFRDGDKRIDPLVYLDNIKGKAGYNIPNMKAQQKPTGVRTRTPISLNIKKSLPITSPIHGWVTSATDQYGVNPDLVYAIMKAESNFNSKAKSPVGAYGLMQLMPHFGTGRLDPKQNVAIGTKYLRQLLGMFPDVRLAIASYNAGQGRVKKLLGKHGNSYDDIEKYLPSETRNYVKKVGGYLGFY